MIVFYKYIIVVLELVLLDTSVKPQTDYRYFQAVTAKRCGPVTSQLAVYWTHLLAIIATPLAH